MNIDSGVLLSPCNCKRSHESCTRKPRSSMNYPYDRPCQPLPNPSSVCPVGSTEIRSGSLRSVSLIIMFVSYMGLPHMLYLEIDYWGALITLGGQWTRNCLMWPLEPLVAPDLLFYGPWPVVATILYYTWNVPDLYNIIEMSAVPWPPLPRSPVPTPLQQVTEGALFLAGCLIMCYVVLSYDTDDTVVPLAGPAQRVKSMVWLTWYRAFLVDF